MLVSIYVKHNRIFVGLIRKEYAEWCNDHCAYPHTEHHVDIAITSHFHARGVNDVPHNEYGHRNDGWHTESTLAYDGTQWCTYKEEEQTSQRIGYLIMPFHLVPQQAALFLVCAHGFPFQICRNRLHARQCNLPCHLLFLRVCMSHDRVKSECALPLARPQQIQQRHRVLCWQLRTSIVCHTGIFVILPSHRVQLSIHRVHALLNLLHVFGSGHTGNQALVHQIEVAVKVYQQSLETECFAVERLMRTILHHLRGCTARRFKTLKLFTIPQFQAQVHFITCHLQTG